MSNVSSDPLLDPPSPEYSKTSPALNQGFVESPEYSKTSPALNQGFLGTDGTNVGAIEVDPLKEHETRMEFYDAVTMYYGFKTQYQQMKNEMKKKLIEKNKKNKTNKNAESLRAEYKKKQPKCINCERKVGTIFETELRTTYSDDDYRRMLVAKCGDKNAPCNLDIQISLPLINTYDEAIQDSTETIDHLKTRIIQIKNDVMFGYEKEETAMKRFTIIGGILADETKILEKLEIDRDKSSNERAKKIKLDESDKMMEKNLEDLSDLVDEFETTLDDRLVKDCATLYVDEIIKNAKTATDNKYDYSEIEYDEDDETFKLTQIPFSLNNKQNYSGEEIYERVLKFVKNDNVSATKLNKTMRKPIASKLALNKTKLKTRKQKIRGDRIKRKQTGSSASEASDSEVEEDSVTSDTSSESASLANSETLSSSTSE
jgi:hypothetical protein